MRISDCSSDVCSSDLTEHRARVDDAQRERSGGLITGLLVGENRKRRLGGVLIGLAARATERDAERVVARRQIAFTQQIASLLDAVRHRPGIESAAGQLLLVEALRPDRKSTRLNSSH